MGRCAAEQQRAHEAAEHGTLDRFPAPFLTRETLSIANISGETVLHVAVFNGHLDQVPRALLTAENLLTKTSNHDTCLHAAAIAGHLDQIPAEVLTHDNLVLPSKSGHTPIHAAAESGFLGQIPRDRLTVDLLISRNDFGDTPLHAAAARGDAAYSTTPEFGPPAYAWTNPYDGNKPIGAFGGRRGRGEIGGWGSRADTETRLRLPSHLHFVCSFLTFVSVSPLAVNVWDVNHYVGQEMCKLFGEKIEDRKSVV